MKRWSFAARSAILDDVMAKGTLVGGTKQVHPKTGKPVFTVDVLDQDAGTTARIDVDFLAHGMTIHPAFPHVAAFFEKRGPDACLVDLARGSFLRPIPTAENRAFYGHGAFSRDGALLFAVEIDTSTHAGLVTIRETKNFDTIGEFPTYGDNPHDCLLVDDGKTLVITNGGGDLGSKSDPCVTYVDVTTRALLRKFTFSDPKINAGHVALTDGGDFVVVSAPRDGLPETTSLGGVTMRVGNGKPQRMKPPAQVGERMKGETLSVCIHGGRRIALATNPHGDIVTVWDLDKQRLLTSIDLDFPRGVTLTEDLSTFVVTHGLDGRIAEIDVTTLAVSSRPAGLFSGSHVHTWARNTSATPRA
ncbi:MAG: DUF1513 domain-containing protein [Polyangiaceae bacterium]